MQRPFAWKIRLLVLAIVAVAAAPLHARTIELTDADADMLAMIGPEAPRLSWAGYEAAPGMFTNHTVYLRPRASLLIRVPLDRIPAGMRITKAEWVLRMNAASALEPRLYVWRVLQEWGPGVCYDYRMTRDELVEWSEPGARASGSDRVERPTAMVLGKVGVDMVLNVTEDVELWYSGAAPNNGWMFTIEDQITMTLIAPAYTTRGSWKLRITYEPE